MKIVPWQRVFDLRTLHPASALSIEEQHILS